MSGMEKISVSRKLELDGLVLETTKYLLFFRKKHNEARQKPPVTPDLTTISVKLFALGHGNYIIY